MPPRLKYGAAANDGSVHLRGEVTRAVHGVATPEPSHPARGDDPLAAGKHAWARAALSFSIVIDLQFCVHQSRPRCNGSTALV
jgi:hypothetical protein